MVRSILWLALPLFFCCVVRAANETEPSLYSADDNVKTLNNDTLELELYNSLQNNLVQFINYFCGDCRRYAPSFKQLARRLYDWQRILTVSVVDCAQERNVKICRDFDIRKTPTLRVYPARFRPEEKQVGYEFDSLEPDVVYAKLADFVSKVMYKLDEQPDFRVIQYVEDLAWFCIRRTEKILVFVYQPAGSVVGRDTIIGLLPWSYVTVRILSERYLFAYMKFSRTTERMIISECIGDDNALHPKNETGAAYIESVTTFLYGRNYMPDAPLATTPSPNATTLIIDEEQTAIMAVVLRGSPKVYRADLEQAIDKLIHIELPKVRVFQGETLLALRQLLNVLRLFSPLNGSGNMLMARLHKFVNDSSGELSGVAFQAQVQSLESLLPNKVFKARRYVGCIESGPFQRGFTCSLWTLFHYLTVQSARSTVLPAGYVLDTMNGFVRHFFGCRNCAQHFLNMAARRSIYKVASRDDEILWLWQAHNEVNQRLAGDSIEDPMFPKIQFPSLSDCAKCQVNMTWRQSAVLEFLKGLYDNKNLSYYGLPTTVGYE